MSSTTAHIYIPDLWNRLILFCAIPVKWGNIDRFWDILSFAAVPVRDMNYVDICL